MHLGQMLSFPAFLRNRLVRAAVMPGAAGYAVRTGVDVVRHTSGAAAAAKSFLDELRGRSPM